MKVLSKTKTNIKSISKTKPIKRLNGFSDSINMVGYKTRLLNNAYTYWSDKRLRWGMILLLIIAPASKFVYLLFPEKGFGEYLLNIGPFQIVNTIEGIDNWFFVTFYYYFSSNGELLAPVILIFGIFLLFPKKYYPSYLVGVPFGYYLSMLVHRMLFTNTNESFHSGGFTSIVTIAYLLFGLVFFVISNKVLFRQSDRKRASEDRIIGILKLPGMSWNDKEILINKELNKLDQVENELFIKKSA